ncbi:MAG: hypothetical protein PHE08_12790, partial [Bacteroidales bacterium]|nr:hypothetical protein [Bacteroidales bacterium]
MKKKIGYFVVAVIIMSVSACNNTKSDSDMNEDNTVVEADTVDATNNFYDNAETYNLETNELEILGEVANPGKVDFSALPLRTVIVKETLLDEN